MTLPFLQVFLEDAGFDWKVLGPDVSNLEYVAWVCDQDAYACSGQKCSAQSMLFMHKNWAAAGEQSLVILSATVTFYLCKQHPKVMHMSW